MGAKTLKIPFYSENIQICITPSIAGKVDPKSVSRGDSYLAKYAATKAIIAIFKPKTHI
jgi:hypothetical protein